jgi:selenocysteine lyase/cysteine desulfurase
VTASDGFPRRRFVAGALSLPAAAVLAGCGGGSGSEDEGRDRSRAASTTGGGGVGTWGEVRALFDLDPEVRHLSTFMFAPHSRPVREAIARHRDGFDRDPRGHLLDNEGLENEVAQAAGRHLGQSADLVALTDSTTMGLGLFFGGLRLRGGDEVLVTAHDHFAAQQAAQRAADRRGARVRYVELYPPAAPERATTRGIVSAYRRGISRRTRAVLVTWVHSSSGLRMPLREIADVVDRANRGRPDRERILLVVDGAHALGAVPAPVAELGCDVLIAGCHKWLLGPRGTGLVWARPRAWRRVAPIVSSFRTDGPDDERPGVVMTPGGYHSYEHRWALAEAFELHARIGAERIAQRVTELSDGLRDGLRRLNGVTVHAPREEALRSGVVAFTVDGLDGSEVVTRLFEEGRVRASVGPYDPQLARLGTCWMNTEDEVEAGIRAVEGIAS